MTPPRRRRTSTQAKVESEPSYMVQIPEPKLEPKIEKPKTNTVEIQTEIPGINENKIEFSYERIDSLIGKKIGNKKLRNITKN